KGRELHIEEALRCIHFGPARDATRLPDGSDSARLVTTGFFTVDEVRLRTGRPVELFDPTIIADRPVVIVSLAGAYEIASKRGTSAPLRVLTGSTVVIPASLVQDTLIVGDARVLRVTVLGT